MAPRAAFLSFRFGQTDGVSVVARTWMDAFRYFGFDVVSVTGGGDADRIVDGFGLEPDATEPVPIDAMADALGEALDDIDLVVVENLLTIPLNLAASRAAASVLRDRPALLHHHDPPWHRDRFAHVTELPATDPAWRHVAINHLLRAELAERSIDATVIYNGFAIPERLGPDHRTLLRSQVRQSVGIAQDALVVAHPVRAIERKNVPAAIELATALGATYWLLGPAEEGYGRTLACLLERAECPVIQHAWGDTAGIYAAADHIAFPSTWEGFGNPPIEAALHRRTVSVGDYPVAGELRALGFEWFDPGDVDGIRAALDDPDSTELRRHLDRNEAAATTHLSLGQMRGGLESVLDAAGWMP